MHEARSPEYPFYWPYDPVISVLDTRFRNSLEKSLILLKAIRYIVKNARNKKNFINYVFNIVFNDKNVNIIIIDVI